MEIKFRIIEKCWQNANRHPDVDVAFFLEENDWDDFGYKTFYYLHASTQLTGTTPECLGAIRIMRKQQTTNECYLLSKQFKNQAFTELPNDFISLSMDVELYMGINKYLQTKDDRLSVINALHLIMSEESKYYEATLYEDNCFKNSLLRDVVDLDNFALKKGYALLNSSEYIYDLRKQSIKVKFEHVSNTIELHFTSVDAVEDTLLPNGIVVFIGKNGCGKSTAIYRLAKLMYTDPTLRFRLKNDVGQIEPNNVGVSKLFLISYSPFDNFILPTSYSKDYIKLLKTGEDVDSRFVFCGIRDIIKEESEIGKDIDNNTDDEILKKITIDRKGKTSLKDISSLAKEFAVALHHIADSEKKSEEWSVFLYKCEYSQPLLYDNLKDLRRETSLSAMEEKFMSLSTGHKFLIHTYVRLLAYIDDNCLILFDEPENHLHPPLLSFMMTEIRTLLTSYHSVMFIATHSPVILQETFAKNVFIVRTNGDSKTITHPQIETYGANVSAITSEVFDLTTDVTKYHDAILHLYNIWDMKAKATLELMLEEFETKIGHRLSDQMESYLINLYTTDKDVEN